jgi:tRNA 2-thiouridine synthesizing protein A
MGTGSTSPGDAAPGATPQRTLDVKGLSCPLPLLRAKIVLERMASGECLQVETTDPYSVKDFEAFCDKTGHALVHSAESNGVFSFLLRRR